jgi:phage terminase large subunit-like protein
MRDRWPDCGFVLDPEAGGETLAQRIDRELGGMVMTHSQRSGPMCRASQLLAETIASGDLEHPDNPALNKHALAAAAHFQGIGWRFTKQQRRAQPIDALIALAMAHRVLLVRGAGPRIQPHVSTGTPSSMPAFI